MRQSKKQPEDGKSNPSNPSAPYDSRRFLGEMKRCGEVKNKLKLINEVG